MTETVSDIYFSIVVLGYGSGRSLIPLVEKLHAMLSREPFTWEIILVGNFIPGRPDETPEVVRELAGRLPHVTAVVEAKQGMAGWDLRNGLDRASGHYIGFIDGDGQMPLESIFDCLTKLEVGKLDWVKTYRISRGDGSYRKFVSEVYNRLFRLLFKVKVRDVNSNPKIFLRTAYQRMHLRSDDWFIDAEMVLRAQELGLAMGEVPMRFQALEHRPSFVTIRTVFEFLRNMAGYKFSKRPEKRRCSAGEIHGS